MYTYACIWRKEREKGNPLSAHSFPQHYFYADRNAHFALAMREPLSSTLHKLFFLREEMPAGAEVNI